VAVNVVACKVCGRKNRVPAAGNGSPKCGQCGSPLPWIADADDDSFADVVEASPIPVLVDLWAPWCGPCRMVSPVLEGLAEDMAGRLKLVKVNVDESPGLARRFAVQGIPSMLIMVGQREIARQTGAAPEHVLRSWIEEAMTGVTS
jgi:thioredoxin 2